MRLILATILGGLVAFFWGFVVWAAPHPMNDLFMKQSTDEATLTATVSVAAAEPGVYMFPFPPDLSDEAATSLHTERHEAGPVGVLIVNDGRPVMGMSGLAFAYLIYAGSALLLALLFMQMPHAGLVTKVVIGVILGLFLSTKVHAINWHFMFFPTDATIARIVETMIGTVAQAAVVGLIIKPKRPASEE